MDKQTAEFINSKGYQDALAEGLKAVAAAIEIPATWRFTDEMLERYPPDMEDDELNMQQRGRSNVTGY